MIGRRASLADKMRDLDLAVVKAVSEPDLRVRVRALNQVAEARVLIRVLVGERPGARA